MKLKTLINVSLLFLLGSLSVNAQYERFLHKDYRGRAKEWGNFWAEKTVNVQYDSALFFKELLGIRQLAIAHKDEGLEMDTYMGELSFFLYRTKYSDQLALSVLNRTLKIAQQKRLLQEASVEKHFGVTYFYRIKNYELAFEHFLRMYELVKNVSKRTFPDKTNCLKELASAYYYFDDYPKTIELAKASIQSELEAGETAHLCRNYGLLGICFRKQNQLDSSDYYFKVSLQASISQRDTSWLGVSYGELGLNAFTRKNYAQAEALLRRSLSMVKLKEEWQMVVKVQTALGAIALLKGKDKEAQLLLLEAKKYADIQREFELYNVVYPWLLKLYVQTGQPQLAMMYSDSADWVKDSLQRQFSARKILRAVQANQLRQHRAEMTSIETQRALKEKERNGVLLLLLIGFALAVYVYQNQRKNHLQDQLISVQQLQIKEQELGIAKQQLQHFTQRVLEKNEFIEQLQGATILTDEQWEDFRALFEKVHGGYLRRVKEKFPTLTPAEIRFIALAKLQLSTKEMASMLGVSPVSVRSTWSRLRKKVQLPEEESLEKWLEMMGE
ncbi:DNA-binding CsgD family transcriptional regulator [Runella defluvii]|uniref:DNA-binding CsgD family transcriptional regulator n=1 Tax=Runella defluvii TaxID=370973 RepID=A0A7W5ZSC3_9BACT|nr:hypothetical protein [Runella defluvii]MBB3842244.1 DNA-binding CsgD family transcriptional regulator [Runella defluvii]